MYFDKLDKKYIEEAVELAQSQYNDELKFLPALYHKDYRHVLTERLDEIFENELGAVAIENGKVVGYMSFWGPIKNQFGYVKGSFSPLYANAYGGIDRGKTATRLFKHVSGEMVNRSILSYALCIYGHDIEILNTYSMNGFAYRCSDSIRTIHEPLDIQENKQVTYEIYYYNEGTELLDLNNRLSNHMNQSPVYFPVDKLTKKAFMHQCEERKSRFFVAKDQGQIIGYLEVTDFGETFITREKDYRHIVGAYLKDNYRGMGIFQSLLNLAVKTLRQEGINKLGVDFETINPNALRFWQKYFDSYTYSMVRRLDERIVEKMKEENKA